MQRLHNVWLRGWKEQRIQRGGVGVGGVLSHHLLGNYAATIIISGGASAPRGRVASRDVCLLVLNILAAFIIPADENLTGRLPPLPHPLPIPLITVATSSGWFPLYTHTSRPNFIYRLTGHENNPCFQSLPLMPKHQIQSCGTENKAVFLCPEVEKLMPGLRDTFSILIFNFKILFHHEDEKKAEQIKKITF